MEKCPKDELNLIELGEFWHKNQPYMINGLGDIACLLKLRMFGRGDFA